MNEYLKIAREHVKKGNDPELLEYWDHLTKFNEYELKKMEQTNELNDLKKEILKLQERIEKIENRNLPYLTRECLKAVEEYHRKIKEIDEYEKPSP